MTEYMRVNVCGRVTMASAAGLSTMQKQVRGLMPHEEEDDIPF